MAFAARHLLSGAIVSVAVVATAGVFLFARPGYHRDSGTTITLPARQPAHSASGAGGWLWPDGTPGWQAGERVQGYLVSGVQSIELQAARLAAARAGLDSERVRVVASIRGNTQGPLAILAAPTIGQTPVKTCLTGMLQGDVPVSWRCPGATRSPGDLANASVLVAAARYTLTYRGEKAKHPLYLVAVARGDVRRVVLETRGLRETLYTRGATWGEFSAAITVGSAARLVIYLRDGRVPTLRLDVAPGRQRVLAG